MRRPYFSAVLAAFLFLCHDAFAQPYPNKTIRLISPFPAGGAVDLIARGIGQKMSEQMGQPVVVENRTGASGAIGAEAVARAAPDGYTLLMGTTSTHGINPALNPKLSYNAIADFTPISLVTLIPHVLVVNLSVPANTLQDFIRLAKAKPGMTYGSAGNGSPHHLVAELLKSMTGIDVVHVAYKGSGQAMTDLIGGQLQFMSIELTGAESFIKAGKIRPLAVASAKRFPGLDVPTFAESGYPGFEVSAWYAIFGPAGMPEAVVSRLNAEIVKSLSTQDLRDRLQNLSATPVGSSPAELGAYMRGEIARWTKVSKSAGIKLD
jgi:tripartite-type tricarboxylate transporter receptor subunit TctC